MFTNAASARAFRERTGVLSAVFAGPFVLLAWEMRHVGHAESRIAQPESERRAGAYVPERCRDRTRRTVATSTRRTTSRTICRIGADRIGPAAHDPIKPSGAGGIASLSAPFRFSKYFVSRPQYLV